MTKVTNESQIVDFVRQSRAAKAPFEIVAGGTRRGIGAPIAALPQLDVSALTGIVNYEPEELLCTVAPATPVPELEAVLAQRGQRLGFDPADWSGVHGINGGTATIGGAVCVDAFGPGRLLRGPARDSLLAYRGVNGLGETIRGGAKVVKNVTGFDIPKLMCGAFGTLSVLTELTFRVYPRPSHAAVLAIRDIGPLEGFAHLRKIARSALEPSGLAYLPSGNTLLSDVGRGAAIIRLEGEAQPLKEKTALANALLGVTLTDVADGIALFEKMKNGAMFAGSETGSDLEIWRLMIPATDAPRIAAEIAAPLWLGDQAGGLLWLAAKPESASLIRSIAAAHDGQAMLLKASDARRAELGLFAPPPPALAKLRAGIKNAFDPDGLLNPGRIT